MNTRTLNTCFVIGLGYFFSTACVGRECTGEEQQEVGATGGDDCTTFTPPQQHEGDKETETVEYIEGTDLRILGDFRNLVVQPGEDDEVVVTYSAVVDLADGRSDEVIAATLAELDVAVDSTDSAVTVTADRSGDSNVAAILVIKMPSNFNGNLVIDQSGSKNHGGEVELTELADTVNLHVDLNSSSTDIVVPNVAKLRTAVISVNGFSNLSTGAFEAEDFRGASLSSENGDIVTDFVVIPSGDNDVQVLSEGGDIDVGLPAGGDYIMQAASTEVDLPSGLPSECESAENEGGASMTCGAPEDNNLTFTLTAPEGAIKIGFVQ